MSKTLQQIFTTNPITVNQSTDLMYFVQSPYTPGTDAGMTFANFSAQFVLSTATISPSHGGTGVNNGTSTITVGGNFAMSGAFTFTGTLTGNTALTFPTSGTLATTAQIPSITPSALTESNDTNVTLTLGGTPATALLQAVSLTLGWTGLLAGTRGGTGVNNGASTITIGGSLSFSGAFTTAFTVTGNTALTLPTSGTLATTSQIPSLPLSLANGGTNASLTANNGGIFYSTASAGAILAGTATAGQMLQSGLSSAPSWSTSVWPSTVSASGILWASSTNVVGQISNSAGGVLISNNIGTPNFLSNPGTTGNLLQSNANTNSSWTTSTYPASNNINTLLYASSANVMAALPTANNSVLVTSAGGVPSLSTTLPSGIAATNMALTTPSVTTAINDSNGNAILGITPSASAVNNFRITNAPTTGQPNLFVSGSDTNIPMGILTKGTGNINFYSNSGSNQTFAIFGSTTSVNLISVTPANTTFSPIIAALGSDTNIALTLNGQGTGGVAIKGTTIATPANAAAGYVGEIIKSVIASGSAVTATSNAASNVTSIALTAGDWDVWGNVTAVTVGTTPSKFIGWTSSSSATTPDTSLTAGQSGTTVAIGSGASVPQQQYNVGSGGLTVFLSCLLGNVSGNGTASGGIYARRVR